MILSCFINIVFLRQFIQYNYVGNFCSYYNYNTIYTLYKVHTLELNVYNLYIVKSFSFVKNIISLLKIMTSLLTTNFFTRDKIYLKIEK